MTTSLEDYHQLWRREEEVDHSCAVSNDSESVATALQLGPQCTLGRALPLNVAFIQYTVW